MCDHREFMECFQKKLSFEIFPQIALALVWGKMSSFMPLTELLPIYVTEIVFRHAVKC